MKRLIGFAAVLFMGFAALAQEPTPLQVDDFVKWRMAWGDKKADARNNPFALKDIEAKYQEELKPKMGKRIEGFSRVIQFSTVQKKVNGKNKSFKVVQVHDGFALHVVDTSNFAKIKIGKDAPPIYFEGFLGKDGWNEHNVIEAKIDTERKK